MLTIQEAIDRMEDIKLYEDDKYILESINIDLGKLLYIQDNNIVDNDLLNAVSEALEVYNNED